MKTKLLFFMLCFFAITSFQAQITSVAIVGEAVGGWPGNPGNPGPSDVNQLTSTDGVNWNISNLVVTTAMPQGGAKFRANNDWVINWGNAAFPNGTATQNGSNILTVGNTYNVAFNSTTGVYSFTSSNTFPSIGIWGPAVDPINGFAGPDVDMSTLDGVVYTLNNYNFTSGTAKFRQNDSNNINWASTAFPTGTGVQDGPNFTVTGGQYNVTFNRTTGEYNFAIVNPITSIGIIGDAVNANGFAGPDVDLASTDGINYSLKNHTFTTGLAKFREADMWNVNWGNTTFPSGTGILNGDNIPVIGATYNVNFNKNSGDYIFNYVNMGIIGSAVNGWNAADVDMVTTNGINYTLTNYSLNQGEMKFRQDDNWDITSYGGTFPSGTSGANSANFVVPAGTYDISFNRNTLEYNFSSTLGVANFSKKTSKVYPNPSYNNWNFISSLNPITAIQILEVSGKIVFETKELSNNVIVDATNLSRGIYFAKVFSSDGIQTIKVVKN